MGVIGASAIVLVLLFAGDLLRDLPSSALAAIVIVAGFSLFDLDTLRFLWRARRSEFFLSMAALAGVALVGVLPGIGIAVALSVANFVRRQWRPYDAVLAVVPGRGGYHDLERHPEGTLVPGVAIYRFDAPIFFANADHFVRQVHAVVAGGSADGTGIRTVVVAAEPITDIDTTGAEALSQLLDELDAAGRRARPSPSSRARSRIGSAATACTTESATAGSSPPSRMRWPGPRLVERAAGNPVAPRC